MILAALVECRFCSRPVREDSYCVCEPRPEWPIYICEWCGWEIEPMQVTCAAHEIGPMLHQAHPQCAQDWLGAT